jgi:hypothetical protein
MSKQNEGRVINRKGARELTKEEVDRIYGSENSINTDGIPTGTGTVISPDIDHKA